MRQVMVMRNEDECYLIEKGQEYWYRFIRIECIFCGRSNTTKYRVYDRPKPKDKADRYIYVQTACLGHLIEDDE